MRLSLIIKDMIYEPFLGLNAMLKSWGLIKVYTIVNGELYTIVNGKLKSIVDEITANLLAITMVLVATPFITCDTLYKSTPKDVGAALILSLFRKILNLVFILRRVTIPPQTGHELSVKNLSSLTFRSVIVTYWEDCIWAKKNQIRRSPNLHGLI